MSQSDHLSNTSQNTQAELSSHQNNNQDILLSRLSLSYLPNSLPCRQHLTDQLTFSIRDMLLNQTSGTSYLSGMPGTGKSVVLRWVLGYLHSLTNNSTDFYNEDESGEDENESSEEEIDGNEDDEDNDDSMDTSEDTPPSKNSKNNKLAVSNSRKRKQSTKKIFKSHKGKNTKIDSKKTKINTNNRQANIKFNENSDALPSFETIWINALKLNSPGDAFSRIWDIMEKYTERPNKRMESQKLGNIFYGSKIVERPYIIIVIDELDYLITKSHNVIYELFNWPQQPGSRLFVVGIANTIDIRAKLPHKVASRIKETECIVFQPYNHFELEEILTQRLGNLKDQFFDDDAITYLCHRVASSSGDIRQLFAYTSHILQRKSSSFTYNTKKKQRRNKTSNLITKDQVAIALDEFVDEYPPTDLPFYDQLFLVCTLLEETSLDQNVNFEKVVLRCQSVIRKAGNGVYIPSIQMWWPVYDRLIGMQAIRENATRTAKSNFPVYYLYGYASYQIEQLLELDIMKDYKTYLTSSLTSLS